MVMRRFVYVLFVMFVLKYYVGKVSVLCVSVKMFLYVLFGVGMFSFMASSSRATFRSVDVMYCKVCVRMCGSVFIIFGVKCCVSVL